MKNENQEQKKLGLRIKSVRVLTGLNQEEFAVECGFNHTSLRNWEFGRVTPRPEAVSKLIKAFNNFDIFVSVEWIVCGSGEGPMFNGKKPPKDQEVIKQPILAAFKKHAHESREKPIIVTVANNDMKPYFISGDIVCGIALTIHEIYEWHPSKKEHLLFEPVLSKWDQESFQPCWLNFDGVKWWARSQCTVSLKPLMSDVIGIITLHINNHNVELHR